MDKRPWEPEWARVSQSEQEWAGDIQNVQDRQWQSEPVWARENKSGAEIRYFLSQKCYLRAVSLKNKII